MTRMAFALILSAIIAGPLISCFDDPLLLPVICSDEYVYGLEIRVVDKETGGPAGLGASVVIRDGSYEEIRIAEDFGPLGVATLAAGERAGIYDVTITADGFREWTRENVIVRKNACHVITVEIIAELERAQASLPVNRLSGRTFERTAN